MHYLDDFLDVTGLSLALATARRDLILKLLANLSFPVAHEKVESPPTRLVFLEIELNAVTLSSHMQGDKVPDIRSSLLGFLARRSVSRRLRSAHTLLHFEGNYRWPDLPPTYI